MNIIHHIVLYFTVYIVMSPEYPRKGNSKVAFNIRRSKSGHLDKQKFKFINPPVRKLVHQTIPCLGDPKVAFLQTIIFQLWCVWTGIFDEIACKQRTKTGTVLLWKH